MSLFQDSGSSPLQRADEAGRIIQMLESIDPDKFTWKEIEFIHQMEGAREVSPKQLFWLRDIKDKYL